MSAAALDGVRPLKCSLEPPKGFRAHDILDFHRHDALALAERIDDGTVWKGL
jgi:hypothetical protein